MSQQVADLLEPCPKCAQIRDMMPSVNNSLNGCAIKGRTERPYYGADGKKCAPCVWGLLEVHCPDCGVAGQVLTRRGKELLRLVIDKLDQRYGALPVYDETRRTVVDAVRGLALGFNALNELKGGA